MVFSEKYGYKPVSKIIQFESINGNLLNGLWSLLHIHVWDHVRYSMGDYNYSYSLSCNEEHKYLCQSLWFNHYKKPLDELSNDWMEVRAILRQDFFKYKWYEVYDFIEFVANNYGRYEFKDNFMEECNTLFEREMSAYRFIDGVITEITEKMEIEAIERALNTNVEPVSTHISRALELLSDRNLPDFRNSMKESISAVESLVSTLIGEKGTLGQLLKELEKDIDLHPALKQAFSKLYGYTNDEGGIRHGLMDSDNTDFHDAKFMLVACSAFINFVEGKHQNKV